MLLNDRTLTLFTALFLVVAIGVILYFGEDMVDRFSGNTAAVAVDDSYAVEAGRAHWLLVTANDRHVGGLNESAIRLVAPPACGRLSRAGAAFVYLPGDECVGIQRFRYCLFDRGRCAEATVTIRVFPQGAP